MTQSSYTFPLAIIRALNLRPYAVEVMALPLTLYTPWSVKQATYVKLRLLAKIEVTTPPGMPEVCSSKKNETGENEVKILCFFLFHL